MVRRLLVVLIAAVLLVQCPPNAAAKDAPAVIQGTWLASAAELGGQKYPQDVVKSIKLVVKGDTYLVTVGAGPDRGTLKVDESAKPKAMDITGTEGPNKDKMIPAIYEQTGDTLRICYDLSGKGRPTAFKTETGTQQFLVVYKRQKP